MRIAVVENAPLTQHGQVGVALHEAGMLVDVYRPYLDGVLPDRSGGYAGLIVFGGGQSALDDLRHPYLPALAALMADRAGAGRAVLGICLGAQLLARGCGGTNRLGVAPEFGWCPVVRTAEGARDRVFASLPARFPSVQWHSDSFTLPTGAVLLAEGERVPHQAFRIGARGYGVQFHAEASRAVVGRWVALQGDEIEAFAPGWIADSDRHAARDGASSDAAGLALARAWLALALG